MSLQPADPAASPEATVPTNGEVPVLQPAQAGGPVVSRLPKPSRLPQARRGSWLFRLLVPAALLLLVLVVAGVWFFWLRGPQVRTDLVTARVKYKDLQLKIVERGTLEAKENHYVKCEVKTGSRGAPKIKWVVDNGALVKTGDLLVDIDDSYLQEQATTQKIARDKAESDKITAEQNYPIAKISIGVAQQTLDKWVKGDFPQQLHALEGQIQTAESNLLQQQDRTAWAGRMVKKGYMTASQEEAEAANLVGDQLSLQQLQEQKKVLTDYTDPVNRQTYENAFQKSKNDERAAYAAMESARAVFLQQDAQYNDLLDQIKQCKVYAANPGIVVYVVPEQSRTGSGSVQSIIAQGEPVQYGQKMMSIPDLSHMLVNVRIHEAFINHMRAGLPVTVRVDALPGKMLKGHVKDVANVASPQDWMSPDVKVYQAYVEITESVEDLKLKPGLSAVSTIFTEERADHVLAVPVQAVLSPLEKGGSPRCFVLTPNGIQPRDVELGLTDERFVQIKSGLNEDEDVILNPRALITEKEKKAAKEEEDKAAPGEGKPGGQDRPQRKGGGDRKGGGRPPAADDQPAGPK
jgi:multidrug efflux pump subunit AcrA (membrane-fusion protein)